MRNSKTNLPVPKIPKQTLPPKIKSHVNSTVVSENSSAGNSLIQEKKVYSGKKINVWQKSPPVISSNAIVHKSGDLISQL